MTVTWRWWTGGCAKGRGQGAWLATFCNSSPIEYMFGARDALPVGKATMVPNSCAQ